MLAETNIPANLSDPKLQSILRSSARIIQGDIEKDKRILGQRIKNLRESTAGDSNDLSGLFDQTSSSDLSNGKSNMYNEEEEVGRHGLSIEQQFDERMEKLKNQMSKKQVVSEETFNNSKMPKEILNLIKGDFEIVGKNDVQPLTEDKEYQQNTKSITTDGIDYDRIQEMIESTVKKYAAGYAKKLLSEIKKQNDSNLALIRIGNSFNFMTADGDLYEAQLKFKKNIVKKGAEN